MSESEAKELCVTKWEYIVNNGGSEGGLYESHPELSELKNGCAYCTLYIASQKGKFLSCYRCPIRVNSVGYKTSRVGCEQDDHPYMMWNHSKTETNAQAVLDLINAT